ncbi:MAG: DUF4112 domain-containing protein [Candidatus Gottesmanbacteria bacterium]|nr:DUF4112 domain-containing protein [Candidatus Gottesmanbacteria bacterium]
MKSHFQFAQRLVRLMDTKFNFFGIRFGIDPLLDFWPGFGSLIGAGISSYLFWIAYRLKVPSRIYFRMGWNIFLDFILGEVPLLGAVFDVFYKANVRNLALLTPYVNPDVLEGVIFQA